MDAPELDRFLESLQAAGVPAEELPALREGAAAVLRTAAGAPVRPVHVDEALRHARWRGDDPAAVTAIRRAGERLVAWQRETAATPGEPAVEPAAAVELEPEPERFRWAATALQVCLAVAVLVVVSRAVPHEHATIRKSPAEIEMDEFLRQERETEAARLASERQGSFPPGAAVKARQPAAASAFRAAQAAAGSGGLEEARREYTRAVAFEPDYAEAYAALASVNLSLARNAAQSGERTDALRYFHDSVSDRRRARQLAAVGDSSRPSSCRDGTDQGLVELERLERDDTAALASLGWRPARARPHRPEPRYCAAARAPKRQLPGPTVVRPTRVRPSIALPGYPR